MSTRLGARAVTWTVANTADSGAGSLRQVVLSAVTGDTVVFSPSIASQVITLACGEIAINTSIAINASGAPGVAVDGASTSRIFNIGPNTPVTLTALTLQRGFASGDGGSVTAGSGSPLILTNASPTLASGSAVMALVGTIYITNTIIASHTIGISRTNGIVNENFNLLFANVTDRVAGITAGANTVYGNPAFAQPGADNYHLTATSAARDTGANIGIGVDFDGDARPIGPGFDIGFDETPWRPAFIPLALR